MLGTIFNVSIEFVTVIFLFYVLVFGCEACGILTPWLGIYPVPAVLEVLLLSHVWLFVTHGL